MSIKVDVKYYPIVKLLRNHIELNGKMENCTNCGAWGVCCMGDRCKKCSCQDIIDCGVHPPFCFTNCSGRYTNAPIFQASPTSGLYSCPDALRYIRDETIIGKVVNNVEIETQCDSRKRLDCCKGDAHGKAACGPWWGPENKGQCNSLMQSYCDIYPHDPKCVCFTSTLPRPQCTDRRCTNTDAMKTSTMLNDACSGNIMTCNQYFTIAEGALENFVDNNNIQQNCEQQVNEGDRPERDPDDTTLSPQTISNYVFIGGGIFVGILVAVVIGLVAFLLWKRRGKTSSKRTPKEKKSPPKQDKKPKSPPKQDKKPKSSPKQDKKPKTKSPPKQDKEPKNKGFSLFRKKKNNK